MVQIGHKHHPHYFSHRVNREVNEVFWQSTLYSLAQSFIFIFEPIYLFTLGFGLKEILFFYAMVYFWYAVLIGFGAKIAGRLGYKHAILVSNFAFVAYWITVFLTGRFEFLFFVAPLVFGIQKSLLWPAYDADVALSADRGQDGRELGVLFSMMQLAFVVGPVVGGFVSEQFGFLTLFIIGSLIMLVSAWPLFRTKDIYSRHQFRFKNLWEVFKEHKSNFFGYWGYAEDLMVMSLWPVFIFIVVPDISQVGTVSTVASLVSVILMLWIGRLTDKTNKLRIIRNSAIVTSFLWVFRFLGRDLAGVVLMDSLTRAARSVLGVPMVAISYEHAASKGRDYAIAYGVFFEFSLSIGKIITALVGIAILHFTGSIFLVFAFAGMLTLLYTQIK